MTFSDKRVRELARIHYDDDIGPLMRELLKLRKGVDGLAVFGAESQEPAAVFFCTREELERQGYRAPEWTIREAHVTWRL